MRRFFLFPLLLVLAFPVFGEGAVPRSNTRVKVIKVTISGNNHFTASRLMNVLVLRPSTLFTPVYFTDPVFQEDGDALERFYEQNGYLEMSVISQNVRIDSLKKEAVLSYRIEEGPLTRIESVLLLGNTVFDDQSLLTLANLKPDQPFRQKQIETATLKILRKYADDGYLDAEIHPEIRINKTAHQASIDLQIIEDQQFRVGAVSIVGNTATRDIVITRELGFRSGEIIRYTALLKTQKRLYLTGLFESVYVRPVESTEFPASRKDIRIELKEGPAGEFNTSIGYSTVEKTRTKIEIFDHNLGGRARKIGASGKLSFVRRSLEISFTEPWTFGRPWRTDINTIYEYLHEPGYDLYRLSGRAVAGRSLTANTKSTITARNELLSLRNVRFAVPEKLNRNTLSGVRINLIRDTRSNLFNPESGSLFDASAEVAGSMTGSVEPFLRFLTGYKIFIPLPGDLVLGSAIDLGFILNKGGNFEVPPQERFYAGDASVLRGFGYQKVGPVSANNYPLGGRLKAVANIAELRFPVYKMLKGAAFIDAGNVWENSENITLSDVRFSVGAGLRVDTPLGLIRADLGINPDRRGKEPGYRLYISMGQAF